MTTPAAPVPDPDPDHYAHLDLANPIDRMTAAIAIWVERQIAANDAELDLEAEIRRARRREWDEMWELVLNGADRIGFARGIAEHIGDLGRLAEEAAAAGDLDTAKDYEVEADNEQRLVDEYRASIAGVTDRGLHEAAGWRLWATRLLDCDLDQADAGVLDALGYGGPGSIDYDTIASWDQLPPTAAVYASIRAQLAPDWAAELYDLPVPARR